MRISRYVVAALLAGSLAGPAWAQEEEQKSLDQMSPTELEDRNHDLDMRVRELSQKIISARFHGDEDAAKKAQGKLNDVNKNRMDVLKARGKIPTDDAGH